MIPRQQYDTTKPLVFLLLLSSDKDTAAGDKTASLSVTLCKNGGSFVSATGAIAYIGNGWHKLTPSAADVGTVGSLVLHAEATDCVKVDDRYEIVPDRGYLLCVTENSSGFVSATTTQYAFTALNTPTAHGFTGGLKGRLFSIISGTGAGQDRVISGSSLTGGAIILTFEVAFEVTPDSSSVWVIRRERLPALNSSLQVTVGEVADDAITAASLATDAGTEIAAAIWSAATRTLTAGGGNPDDVKFQHGGVSFK